LQLDLDKSSSALQAWTFQEPVATEDGQEGKGSAIITICAPASQSALDAYMYFAQVKDTSGAKQTQYQKYYRSAERFLESINLRFGTEHSFGVLRGMLTAVKDARKRKLKTAMAVKILAVEPMAFGSCGR
jgi:hypothetical protein